MRSRLNFVMPPRTSQMASSQSTAPTVSATGSATRSRPVACPSAMKISGRMTAPPSWFASCEVRARADTRTITPSPSAATAGATHRIITAHSRVGMKSRCITGQAIVFVTTAKHRKPIHDTMTAGTNAPSSFARKRSRSLIGRCSNPSIVLRSFSPANASAARTTETINGTIKKRGARR